MGGEVLEPVIIGNQMKIHPMTIMMGVFLFGYMWGVTGMILSIPMIICFKIQVQHMSYDARIQDAIVNFIENNIFAPSSGHGHSKVVVINDEPADEKAMDLE